MFTALAVITAGGGAVASEKCFVPVADWQPRAAVAELAAENGWSVRRIKIDDGCYEIKGRNKTGQSIEVKINPKTLEIIEIEFEDDD